MEVDLREKMKKVDEHTTQVFANILFSVGMARLAAEREGLGSATEILEAGNKRTQEHLKELEGITT